VKVCGFTADLVGLCR